MKPFLKKNVLRNGSEGSEENGGGWQMKCILYPVHHAYFSSCQYCLDDIPGHHMIWKTSLLDVLGTER